MPTDGADSPRSIWEIRLGEHWVRRASSRTDRPRCSRTCRSRGPSSAPGSNEPVMDLPASPGERPPGTPPGGLRPRSFVTGALALLARGGDPPEPPGGLRPRSFVTGPWPAKLTATLYIRLIRLYKVGMREEAL